MEGEDNYLRRDRRKLALTTMRTLGFLYKGEVFISFHACVRILYTHFIAGICTWDYSPTLRVSKSRWVLKIKENYLLDAIKRYTCTRLIADNLIINLWLLGDCKHTFIHTQITHTYTHTQGDRTNVGASRDSIGICIKFGCQT